MDNNSADKCPLCGEDNQCAMAAGKPPETCWCMTTEISAAALEALPESERGVRCICPGCANDERKTV
jgi:Cysteine-rich CWC